MTTTKLSAGEAARKAYWITWARETDTETLRLIVRTTKLSAPARQAVAQVYRERMESNAVPDFLRTTFGVSLTLYKKMLQDEIDALEKDGPP